VGPWVHNTSHNFPAGPGFSTNGWTVWRRFGTQLERGPPFCPAVGSATSNRFLTCYSLAFPLPIQPAPPACSPCFVEDVTRTSRLCRGTGLWREHGPFGLTETPSFSAIAMHRSRTTIAKLIALWFVVLIVLPFTAPFQTIDLSAPRDKAPTHALLSIDKLAKDAASPASTDDVIPCAGYVALPAASPQGRPHRRHVVPAILRL
jgi:hypothetical protein